MAEVLSPEKFTKRAVREYTKRIGILGGAFNPIHLGHLRVAEEVREKVNLEKIIFIPSGLPPLKYSEIEDSTHRYSMTAMAISSNPYFEVSDIECKTKERTIADCYTYSIDTIRKLNTLYPDDELFFILGIDAFIDLPRWKNPDELINIIDFIVISRPQYLFEDAISSPYLDVDMEGLLRLDRGEAELYTTVTKNGRTITFVSITHMAISGSEIRRLLREGKSVKYLLPENVESYIISNRLYGSSGSY